MLYLGTAEGSISEGAYCNMIISPLMGTLLSDLKNFKFLWYVSGIVHNGDIYYGLLILGLGGSQALRHQQHAVTPSEELKSMSRVARNQMQLAP